MRPCRSGTGCGARSKVSSSPATAPSPVRSHFTTLRITPAEQITDLQTEKHALSQALEESQQLVEHERGDAAAERERAAKEQQRLKDRLDKASQAAAETAALRDQLEQLTAEAAKVRARQSWPLPTRRVGGAVRAARGGVRGQAGDPARHADPGPNKDNDAAL